MSGKLSVFAANALLGHVCGVAYSAPATVYVGVSTADPGVGLAEPVGNGYARAAIGFAAAAYRRVAQDGAATFAMATGAWGTVTHWALFDAASGGNMLAYGDFGQSKAIVAGNTLTIPADSIYVTFEPGGVGTATVHDLLDLMFGGVAYSAPATWLGVATETLGDATTGSTVAEPSGGGYGRVRVNVVGGAAPAWGAAAGRVASNVDEVDLPVATGTWGTVVAAFVASGETGGEVLFFDNGMVDQVMGIGDMLAFAAGAVDLSIN